MRPYLEILEHIIVPLLLSVAVWGFALREMGWL